MWNTPIEARILMSAERDLIVTAVVAMRDEMEEDDYDLATEVEIFERMTREEKVYSLAYVIEALVSDKRGLGLSLAWTDATIYAIFQYIGYHIWMEIEDQKETKNKDMTYRKLLANSLGKKKVRQTEWMDLVEQAADKILWDRDFENEYFFLDLDPEISARQKRDLGIDPDYFVEPVPDVSEEEARRSSRLIDFLAGKSYSS